MLADLFQMFFHKPPISGSMEFAFPALLSLSSQEEISLLQCCEGLYHVMAMGSSQTKCFLSLS